MVAGSWNQKASVLHLDVPTYLPTHQKYLPANSMLPVVSFTPDFCCDHTRHHAAIMTRCCSTMMGPTLPPSPPSPPKLQPWFPLTLLLRKYWSATEIKFFRKFMKAFHTFTPNWITRIRIMPLKPPFVKPLQGHCHFTCANQFLKRNQEPCLSISVLLHLFLLVVFLAFKCWW